MLGGGNCRAWRKYCEIEGGAHVGDVYMTVVHTAELCAANPIEYVRALMQDAALVAACRSQWTPWNYTGALACAAWPAPVASSPADLRGVARASGRAPGVSATAGFPKAAAGPGHPNSPRGNSLFSAVQRCRKDTPR